MKLIFDRNSARFYEAWRRSSQNRTIERSMESLVLSVLDPVPGERLLDIGCGNGTHLLMFNKLGLDVTGVDASVDMVEEARSRLGHRSVIKMGMAEDLPFDDNEFDLAVLIHTLEFLDNPLPALREAGRVARRKVFIGVLNSLSCNGILKKFQGYFGDPLFGQATFYNLWQIKSLLQLAYGDVPISWESIRIVPSFVEEMVPFGKEIAAGRHSPFGFFLGLAATMVYRVHTDNLPLKVRLKTARQSLFPARSLEDLKQRKCL
ncbi:MAG: class I SAM-dependent methyltransferase [Deltaproteobacteria bacterium]|nr:class I SAM-dependent methyltransferase [Deltaproteobacteria bacterium]